MSTRVSRARTLVLDGLRRAGAFRSAQALHLELASAGQKVSLATVYRNLQALAAEGAVDQARVEGAESLYRLCAEEGHHHHVVCRSCGQSAPVVGPDFETWADQVAEAAGYTQVDHRLEINGICAACRGQATPA
ncbi:MAG: transcriptional repressor [Bifidobacteriaceae bacterium]|jgi:Fur family ferric uptake transcriptional regulator|nr:transcriptional repressor [Bifidobacteriaceae bacterium]